MRITASRSVNLLAVAALLAACLGAVSGCGSEKEADSRAHVATDRARQVAAAWDGSTAAAAWRAGYYPMGKTVQLPRGGLRSQADKQAYEDQSFVLRGKLPDTWPKDGQVTWAGSGSVTRSLVGADRSYNTLVGARVNGKSHLTVTGAKLGEMSVATSRGRRRCQPGSSPWMAMPPPQAGRCRPVETAPAADKARPWHPRLSGRPAGPDCRRRAIGDRGRAAWRLRRRPRGGCAGDTRQRSAVCLCQVPEGRRRLHQAGEDAAGNGEAGTTRGRPRSARRAHR